MLYEWTTTSIVSGQRVSIYLFFVLQISLNIRELNRNDLNCCELFYYGKKGIILIRKFYCILVWIFVIKSWYCWNCNIVKCSSQIMINKRIMKLPGNLSHNEIVSISGYFWRFVFYLYHSTVFFFCWLYVVYTE